VAAPDCLADEDARELAGDGRLRDHLVKPAARWATYLDIVDQPPLHIF
jgi:hypothetical protein